MKPVPMMRTVAGLAMGAAMGFAQPAPPAPPSAPRIAEMDARRMVMMGEVRSFLGVGVTEVTAERAKALKLKEEQGVEVTRIEEESPAAKAGLQVGDAVLEYNGQRVEGTEQFVRFVRETPPGRTVKLLVSRNGATQTVAATLATRKTPRMEGLRWEMPQIEVNIPDMPRATMSWRSSLLGVEAEALEPQLAIYFGVKDGVLVRSVTKATVAEKAGLKAGDVLLKVDDTKVAAPRDVTAAIRTARSKEKKQVAIVLMRDKREMTLTAVFEDEAAPTPRPATRTKQVTLKQMEL